MRSYAVDLPIGPLTSFVCSVMRGRESSLDFSGLISWLARRFRPIFSSSIVINFQLFKDLSSTIALKYRGFVSVSSNVTDWNVEMKAEYGSESSVSWIPLYRASISEYQAADFHQACDGMGKCVVVVKAENGRIAAAYNEDGFTSVESVSPNLNGFIVSVAEDGGCRETFHRNDHEGGIVNLPGNGTVFGSEYDADLFISNDCHQGEYSFSILGESYGVRGSGTILFGQTRFRVVDYEVFKIVIE
jgi:hypothetical protein